MSQFYKILKADPLGEPWTPNAPDAKPIQNFWCQVEGEELAVSIGKQVGNTLTPGESIYGDLMKAQSQKGTNYWKFKSAKVPEGVQRPASTPAQATAQQAIGVDMGARMPDWFMPIANQIDYIFREMKKMDTTLPFNLPADDPVVPAEKEPLPEPQGEELTTDVDPETQRTLDDIFGEITPPETPEDK